MTEASFIAQSDAVGLIGRDDVSFVDASWYLPAQKRNGEEEYRHMRIPGAVFFDIDKISDPNSDLPHMLPSPEEFARTASVMGISNEHQIIVYDGPGLFSSARAWWTFKIMGAQNVKILEGGMDAWKAANLPIETGNPNPPLAHIFTPHFNPGMVASMDEVVEGLKSGDAVVLDARPHARFYGEAKEPRPGLRSGHMPGAINLPSSSIVENGLLKSREALEELFSELGIGENTKVITSCGSGVTAAILSLALSETSRSNHALYDGSWAEWGQSDGPPVTRDDD